MDVQKKLKSFEATYHGVQSTECSTNSETAETGLGDGSVDDPPVAEAVQQALCHLVCTIVLGDLLTQDEDLVVALQLLSQCLVQRISDGVVLCAVGSVCSCLQEGGDRANSGLL